MKNKMLKVFIFGLCPIVPAASHFAYGLILAACFWSLFFVGIIAKILARLMDISKYEKLFINILIIIGAAFFNFLLEGIIPIIQGAIYVYIYILSASYILTLALDDYYTDYESLDFPLTYSSLILIISALREVFAFGSISFPVSSGFLFLHIPYFTDNPPFRFLGTTAGSFILLGIILRVYFAIKKQQPFLNEER